jgi:hypothetical protein
LLAGFSIITVDDSSIAVDAGVLVFVIICNAYHYRFGDVKLW